MGIGSIGKQITIKMKTSFLFSLIFRIVMMDMLIDWIFFSFIFSQSQVNCVRKFSFHLKQEGVRKGSINKNCNFTCVLSLFILIIYTLRLDFYGLRHHSLQLTDDFLTHKWPFNVTLIVLFTSWNMNSILFVCISTRNKPRKIGAKIKSIFL